MISLHSILEYPPRSPDLTPPDHFLFGHLKTTIFKTPIHTIEELKDRIAEEGTRITPDTLQKMFDNMKRRVNLCIQENGYHYQLFSSISVSSFQQVRAKLRS